MIVSSVITHDDVQVDGRRWVRELHKDALGNEYPVIYLAEDKFDAVAAMKARAKQMELDIAAQAAEQIEVKAAQAKVGAVLNAAVVKGTISAVDLAKAGR